MMVFFVSTVFATFLFQCCSKAFAYPPRDLNMAARSTIPLPLLFNASALPLQTDHIHCFPSGDFKTSLAGCRPSLNYIRAFPAYSLRQIFQMGRSPSIPEPGSHPVKPPIIVYVDDADCAISIACKEPFRQDTFSWQQVRAAALAIEEACEDDPGYGGWAPVGAGVGWEVRVLGFRDEVRGVNGTVMGEGADGMASTAVVADS